VVRLGCFSGWAGFQLLVLQALLGGPESAQAQVAQMGPQVALNLRLSELPLETLFRPLAVSLPSSVGLQLGVGIPPAYWTNKPAFSPQLRQHTSTQAAQLKLELCRPLRACPQGRFPPCTAPGAFWIPETGLAAGSRLLYAEIRPQLGCPPTPCWPTFAVSAAASWPAPCFLFAEVQRPLAATRRKPLGRVGLRRSPTPCPSVAGIRRCGRLRRHFKRHAERPLQQ